jgi:hypothetical protein
MSTETVPEPVAPPVSEAHAHDGAFRCPNCSTETEGEHCRACGQKRLHEGDLSVAHAWHHLVHETLHLDGKIFNTVKLLFTRPGQLTLDFLEGRRARHVHPIRLFLVFSAIFFLVSTSGVTAPGFYKGRGGERVQERLRQKAEAEGVAYETVVRRVDLRLALTFKVAYTACVIASGVWFWLLFRGQRRYLAEHMVMALHLACVAMTLSGVLSPFIQRGSGNPWLVNTYVGGMVAGFITYAGRRVYGPHLWRLTLVGLVWVVSVVAVPLKAAMIVLDRSLR